MSKRFPVPDFDRDQYKNRSWVSPSFASEAQRAKVAQAGLAGQPQAFAAYAVGICEEFAKKFDLTGPHLHALMCVLPSGPVHVVGRSWAWPIQRALVVDSLEASATHSLIDWTTPRPMNTRLGPQDGIEISGGVVYAIFATRDGQHWVGNRTLSQVPSASSGGGLELMSACSDQTNDFHACNLEFRW